MVLSPRKLIFNDSAYAWECSGGYWPEYFANPVKYGWQKDLREKGRERCYFDLIAKYVCSTIVYLVTENTYSVK